MIRTVIHLRGTNEPLDVHGISLSYLYRLDPNRFRIVTPNYPADYGLRKSFAESNAAGRAKVLELIRSIEGPIILSGYSQGAYIMGDLARDIAMSQFDDILPSRIEAVTLLADPKRPEGEGIPPYPGGYGIAGQRDIPDIPVFWATASRDPISALAADNPLRSAADLTAAFTLSPLGWDEWAADMLAKLAHRQLQPWWMFWLRPGRWGAAIDALNGYLFQGRHTDDYIREGVCARLAAAVNEAVS
jgi:hypothetical protein